MVPLSQKSHYQRNRDVTKRNIIPYQVVMGGEGWIMSTITT